MDEVKKFIAAIEKLQEKHKMMLHIDDANPFEMIVRRIGGNEEVLAWLGVGNAEIKKELVIFAIEK